MTAQEVYDTIYRMFPSDISTFNTVPPLQYEVWQSAVGSGLQSGELNAIIIDAQNWNDTFMNSVNAIGNVAGVKPKKRCEGCS